MLRHFIRTSSVRFGNWRDKSVNRSILAAAFTIGSLSLIVKIVFAAKDIFVARQYGTSSEMDAYLLAFALLSFIINVSSGSFEAALIPTYIQIRDSQGAEAARSLFAAIMGRSIVLLLGISLILVFAAPILISFIAGGFTADNLEFSRGLFLVMLPMLLVNGLAVLWGSILNANERFAPVAAAPVVVPVATILFVLLTTEYWGIQALLVGFIAGSVVQAVILAVELNRHGMLAWPRLQGDKIAIHSITVQYLPLIAGAFLISGTDMIDKAMATPLGSGSVSSLNYGYKLVALVLNTAILALGTSVLPPFSRMVAVRDWPGLLHTLRTYSVLILVVSIPATIGLVLLSEDLVRFLFQGGAFTEADVRLVSRIQSLYFLQLPFHLLGILFVRVISSLRRNEILMVISAFNIVLNIAMNLVFIRLIGVEGIALSTSVVYFVSFVLIALSLWRILRMNIGA